MSLHQLLAGSAAETAARAESGNRQSGVAIGIVTNVKDPDNLGRVRVKFPWFSDDHESQWARVATLMAGKERGSMFLPEVDDEVLLAFEHGDMRRPYVIGALWNGVDVLPPEFTNDGKNNVRFIKSRSGHIIKLDDTDGSEKIEIIDKSGKNSVVIDTKENTITISTDKDMVFQAPQGKISLTAKEVELKSSAALTVEAGAEMNIKTSATLNVKGATVNIN
jgi:uncharacterized protein involved in type VI secretion and phage assembly